MKRLVMIPALACDRGLYRDFVATLGPGVEPETIVCDGETMAQCVAQVLTTVDGPFVILGTSFGARVALEATLAAPKRVQGLVVIGSGPGPAADPKAGFRRSERVRGGEFNQVVQEMAAIISHLPGPRGAATKQAFIDMSVVQGAELMARQSDALAKRIDLWPRLSQIHCPALMLWGAHDQFSPASDGAKFASAVAGARYVELPDCGHFPTLEYPPETAAAVRDWMVSASLLQ